MSPDRPIIIALVLFSVIIIAFFLVVPEYKTFRSLQADLGKKRAEFNAGYDYYAEVTKTYFNLHSQPENLEKVNDALPENPDLGQVVYFFQKTATGSGLIIKDLYLSKSSSIKSASKNQVKDLVFSVNLIGSYSSLQNFISALEKSARLFEVTSISFDTQALAATQLPQFQSQQTFTFSLEIKTHSY